MLNGERCQYDGPTDGMILVHPRTKLYAGLAFETEEDDRIFTCMELTDESAAYEKRRHEDFIEYVGDYWTFYSEDGAKLEGKGYHPSDKWSLFYNKYPLNEQREPEGKIVGWIKQ